MSKDLIMLASPVEGCVEVGPGTSPGIWIHPVEASSRPGAPFAGVLTYTSGTAAETSGDATLAQKHGDDGAIMGMIAVALGGLGGQLARARMKEEEPEKRIQRQLKSETVCHHRGPFPPRHLLATSC
nr:hypothetical protein LTR18_001902 [Exophiala xenobiotica]